MKWWNAPNARPAWKTNFVFAKWVVEVDAAVDLELVDELLLPQPAAPKAAMQPITASSTAERRSINRSPSLWWKRGSLLIRIGGVS
jgi:hypothetical protein